MCRGQDDPDVDPGDARGQEGGGGAGHRVRGQERGWGITWTPADRHLILISSLPRPGRVRDALLHRVRAQARGGGRHEEGGAQGEAVMQSGA